MTTPINAATEAVMSHIRRTGDYGQYATFHPETVARAAIESIPEDCLAAELGKHSQDMDQTAVYEGSCWCGWEGETASYEEYDRHLAQALKAALLTTETS